jgi:AcrR family transcriptional regulator
MEQVQPMPNTQAPSRASPEEPIHPACSPDSRRERKKQETLQKLLESAWQLFQEKGYERTTVEDITEAADVAKGTFFNYFETREAMLSEIASWRIALLRSRVFTAADLPDSAVARIKLLLQAIAAEFPTVSEMTRHLPSASAKREGPHRLDSIVHELVQQAQASGEIRGDVDPWLVARLMMTSCIFNLIRHCPQDGTDPGMPGPQEPFSLQAQIVQSVDALLDGLGGPKRRDL